MVRHPRIVVPNWPHHITQRGNNKQKVFFDEKDYKKYLFLFEKFRGRYRLTIIAYCLMPNHIHFIAIPEKSNAMAKTFNITHTTYAQYFNKKFNHLGHLWQGRFYSCVLDEHHLITAIQYVETNPVRAKLVQNPLGMVVVKRLFSQE